MRDVLERASARETAARVAAGALARQLLAQVAIEVASHVIAIGPERSDTRDVAFDDIAALPDDSPTRCVDEAAAARMIAAIDAAREAGDTLGGVFEVAARGVPAGLGSYAQWDRRLDGRLAQALMSIPAIKAVSIGIGAEAARLRGSQVHDEILPRAGGGHGPLTAFPAVRPTNHAGGLEGGVTNGEELRVSASMKPIATLMAPLRSIDLADRDRGGGGHRAQRRLRRAGRVGGWRGDGGHRAWPTPCLSGSEVIRSTSCARRYADWRRQVEERFARPRESGTS